jgi:hypothetical protein
MRRKPARERVKSSVIAAVTYDEPQHVLQVEFHTGRIYDYLAVPRRVYQAMLDAESVGQYFNQVIRTNYRSVLVRHPEVRELRERHPREK